MKRYNLIVIFNEAMDRVLLCRRRKDPYQGLSNFIGGKIEEGESGQAAAYREMEEESGLTGEDVSLFHFMDLTYHLSGFDLEVYAGRCTRDVEVHGEENELYWSPLDVDFTDQTQYAGEGSLGHILARAALYKSLFFQETMEVK